MDESITCSFTGHRPERLPWGYDEDDSRCLRFKVNLEQQIKEVYQTGVRHFITGMALGTDQYFAEIVLAQRDYFPDITLECAIPCHTQSRSWHPLQQERYQRILAEAQFETLVQHDYTRDCMMRRNRYMVEHSSTMIAAYDGDLRGGTARTIAYAMKSGLNLFILSLNGEEYK